MGYPLPSRLEGLGERRKIHHRGPGRSPVRKWTGQFSVQKDLVIFPGHAVKIRDCPEKIGTDGHFIPWSTFLDASL